MSPRLLLSLLMLAWILPSPAFAQDQQQVADPEGERLLLQERIDQLRAHVRELEAKEARLARKVKELEARQAKLTEEAENKARVILAEAALQAAKTRAAAEAEAGKIMNKAHDADPELYLFLKKVEVLKLLLEDRKTILLIPGKSELFNMLFDPPRQEKKPKRESEGKSAPARGLPEKADRSDEWNSIWQAELGRLLKKMHEEGRLEMLDDPGAQQREVIPAPRALAPKK